MRPSFLSQLSRRALPLLALLAVVASGCSRTVTVYHEVSRSYLCFELPSGWEAQASKRNAASWTHPELGTLTLTSPFDPDPSQMWGALNRALTRDPNDPGAYQAKVQAILAYLEPARSHQQVALALGHLEKALKLLSQTQDAKDPQPANEGLMAVYELSKVSFDNSPAALLTRWLAIQPDQAWRDQGQLKQTEQGLWVRETPSSLFFLWKNHRVTLSLAGGTQPAEVLASEFAAIASSLQIDCAPPEGAEAVPGSPSSRVASSPAGQRDAGLFWFVQWGPTVVFLFFFAVPAFMGASSGYHRGDDPRQGASAGAAKAVGISLTVLVVLGGLWVLGWAMTAPKGSGTVAPFGAALLGLLVGVPVGLLAAGCLAMAAAGGAYLGASHGPTRAGLFAALAAPVGLLIMGLVLYVIAAFQRPKKRWNTSWVSPPAVSAQALAREAGRAVVL